MTKYTAMLTFETTRQPSQEEIIDFIKTELSCGGGNRHPNDDLFPSLQNVTVIRLKEEK